MKKLLTIALLAGTFVSYGQRMKKERLTVDYIQPPTIALPEGMGFQSTVILDYKAEIDRLEAEAEAEYQQKLAEYPEIEASAKAAYDQRYAEYERALEEWNNKGAVGKIIEKQLLENSKPQAPAAYYPPARPVKRTVPHERLFNEQSLASTYCRVEGLDQDPNGVAIEVHLFGFENTDPIAEKKEYSEYNSKTKQTTKFIKSFWTFDYRHNMTVRAVLPDGTILFDENPKGIADYKHYESEQVKGSSPGTSSASELDKMQSRVVEDNMKTIQWIINDKLGTTRQSRDIAVIVPSQKKQDYSDFETAMLDAKEGYAKLIDYPEDARVLLGKAIAAWEAALTELDMDDNKARVNRKVAPDLYTNLITACIFAGDFAKADEHFASTLRLDLGNRDSNNLEELKALLDDLRARGY